jgi:DNA-binding LacI/PurR family transcriptional regulator
MAISLPTVKSNSDHVGRLGAQLLLAQMNKENKQILHVHSDVSLVVRTLASISGTLPDSFKISVSGYKKEEI